MAWRISLTVYYPGVWMGGALVRRFWTGVLLLLAAWGFGLSGMSAAAETVPSTKDLQSALSDRGFDAGVVDGKWGKRTERALQAFQAANGLPPTGVLDTATVRKLVPKRTDLRAEMGRKPEDRKELLLVRSTADLVSLYRLARTGIGQCRPARLDLGKIRARVRTTFGDRVVELERIIESVAAREDTGLLFLDEAFRAKTCDGWTATARSTGLALDPPLATNVAPPTPQASEPPPPREIVSVVVTEPQAKGAAPQASSTVASKQSATPGTSHSSLPWGTFSTLASLTAFLVWRRLRRSPASAMPTAILANAPQRRTGTTTSSWQTAASAGTAAPRPPSPSDLSEQIAAHNRAVAEAIRVRSAKIVAPPVPSESTRRIALEPIAAFIPPADPTPPPPSLAERIAAHNRAVDEVMRAGSPTVFPSPHQVEPIRPVEPSVRGPISAPSVALPRAAFGSGGGWLPRGASATIAGLVVPGGLIWVGSKLPRRNDPSTNENCLIDPKLPVARKVDTFGQYMPYWPSYGEIPSSSRRAYLDWLAGPRSDPSVYIGYVFLYFYGLERRLMLDGAADDREQVRSEVERLLSIYGENHSFRRYASELLSAETVRHRGADADPEIEHDIAGFEVPLGVKIALGARVRDSRAIEPDLLLAFVRTHPETRLRTPARRAAGELRDLFAIEIDMAFPKGVKVGSASRIRKLSATYRAASGTFEVELLPKSLGLPDITGLAEPAGMARRILDACTDRLDAYSRELGKAAGFAPTLAAVGKLPSELRLDRAAQLPGTPLDTLARLAEAGEPVAVKDLGERVGLPGNGSIDKGRLRDWSALLSGLGFGITCDPVWTLRAAKADTPAVVFPLSGPLEDPAAPTDGYRHAQITIALAMMVTLADGVVEPSEQRALVDLIDRFDGIAVDERRRLTAEIRVQAADPHALSDLKTRLKTLPTDVRFRLADEIVSISGADGVIDPREVALLEKLFRQIDVDERTLYARLHGGVAAGEARRSPDGGVAPSISGAAPTTTDPSSGSAPIDPERLAAIRRETAGITSVLSEIFAEDEEPEIPMVAMPDTEATGDDGGLDGLDRRHRSLVAEILERAEWPRGDFERLVRGIGLMPGAAIELLNDWAYDRFDECLLEGEDPIVANHHLIPTDLFRASA